MHLTWNRSPIMERPSPTPEVSKSLGWSLCQKRNSPPATGREWMAATRLEGSPLRVWEIATTLGF